MEFFGTDQESLLMKVAWYYYEQGMTQQEIGKRLGFSRTKIVRLLATARERGIVQIKLVGSYKSCLEKEDSLKKRYSLLDAIIIPVGRDFQSTKTSAGKACALYLEKTLQEGDIFGVTWGTTLYEAGRFLEMRRDLHLTVVQLMGGLNTSDAFNPQEIVRQIAAKLHARGVWLNTPAVVANPEIKRALLSDDGVQETMMQAKYCHKALLGIGDISDTASLLVSRALSREDMEDLIAHGAVGDIMGWFFDIDGKIVDSEVMERVLSVPLTELSEVPARIGVASGDKKVNPFLGALRGGHINVIITDEATADGILERS
jgi:DNA-binding transcriptional regulator LsrR (DeoR family)